MSETQLDTWAEAIDEYPPYGKPEAKLRALVRFAILAPSSHNTQPWKFRIAGATLQVMADRTRSLPVVDPHGRALVISCGAAVEYAAVAARHFGDGVRVELLPASSDEDLLATMRLAGAHDVTPADDAMFAAMRRRWTMRSRFSERVPGPEVLNRLVRAAAELDVTAQPITSEQQKAAVAELITEGDELQMADPAFRRELAAWMRPNDSGVTDGIPGSALGFGAVASRVAPLLVRTFDVGAGQAARDRELAELSPVLLLLATPLDSAAHWLDAGRALARVLLLARDAGMQASFLNQPVEVPSLRPRLTAVTGVAGEPQLLLRLGFASGGRSTPRRSVESVLA